MASLTLLDDFLIALLVVGLPARALWRDFRGNARTANRARTYRTSILIIATLMALLSADWLQTGRSVAALGLGWPVSLRAVGGLAFATGALLILVATASRPRQRTVTIEQQASIDRLMPQGALETRYFVAFGLLAGFGWEVLFRGFLLFVLIPPLGQVAAVTTSALSYGLGHGMRSRSQAVQSVLAAFAFTLAYVLTQNLWGLILVHAALPFVGLLAAQRATPR